MNDDMKLDINANVVVHTYNHDADVAAQLHDLIGTVAIFNRKLDQIMTDLSKLIAAVEKQTTVTASAIALIEGLAEEIRNLPANQQAINDLADQVDQRAQALSAAVTANTPTTP